VHDDLGAASILVLSQRQECLRSHCAVAKLGDGLRDRSLGPIQGGQEGGTVLRGEPTFYDKHSVLIPVGAQRLPLLRHECIG
jgi:hypothetical protein